MRILSLFFIVFALVGCENRAIQVDPDELVTEDKGLSKYVGYRGYDSFFKGFNIPDHKYNDVWFRDIGLVVLNDGSVELAVTISSNIQSKSIEYIGKFYIKDDLVGSAIFETNLKCTGELEIQYGIRGAPNFWFNLDEYSYQNIELDFERITLYQISDCLDNID